MRRVFYRSIPYCHEDVTLALESGVDGLIVPDDNAEGARGLARITVFGESAVSAISLRTKADEEHAAALVHAASSLKTGEAVLLGEDSLKLSRLVVLSRGWEIIPLENLLASAPGIAVEVGSQEEAVLAQGVLERGVDTLVLTKEALPEIKAIVAGVQHASEKVALTPAVITRIAPAGMGHRVCVDTTTRMHTGQGMLVGNSAAFTFLVNAETEHNEYVASRPFRVNAGGVHSYAVMPEDRTAYLDELGAGSRVLIVDHTGTSSEAIVGRVKVERRPMLMLEAVPVSCGTENEPARGGAVFLQNAETIRLVTPEGKAISVVSLKEGDTVLCRVDIAGRHFGVRITEDIKES